MKQTSEFGKGLSYCLGLFLSHEGRIQREKEMSEKIKTASKAHKKWFNWTFYFFNAASDHLYELQYEQAPKQLQNRLKTLQNKVLEWGHGYNQNSTEKDVFWAIKEAKSLLMEIDKNNGISVIKGEYE